MQLEAGKILTKDDIILRTADGKLKSQEVNVGSEEDPKFVKMFPLTFGEILKLGRIPKEQVEEKEKLIIQFVSEHVIEPKLTVEDIENGDNITMQSIIRELNKISKLI